MLTQTIFPDSAQASAQLARETAELIRAKAQSGQRCVLGLATGSTPLAYYAELIRLHREDGLSFAHVTSFNLDEYLGLAPEHDQSYAHFMKANLFQHLDIDPAHTHLPCGLVSHQDVQQHCADYEQKIKDAGGIDLQILGIGGNGHIGFNEPPTLAQSITHLVTLKGTTRQANARFFDSLQDVPTHALTVGISTILSAKKIALLAFGEKKAAIIAQTLNGPITPEVPASHLQTHPSTHIYLDQAAASQL